MIHALDNRHAPLRPFADATVVPLSARGDAAHDDSRAPLIEEMTRHMAVQQFVESLMQGEPELTGVPAVSLDGEY
jgi:hypothetical protein